MRSTQGATSSAVGARHVSGWQRSGISWRKPSELSSLAQRLFHRTADGKSAERSSPVDLLSDRELEVLQLIGQGMTTRSIAERLHVSQRTIDTYRERLKQKLGLKAAVELHQFAIQWAMENR
jgi:DNA-binding NarL/FixJ family response regulator